MDWRSRAVLWVLMLGIPGTAGVRAQIDPKPRQLLQAGYNQPVEGQSPINAYAYYHWNRPHLSNTNLALRVVVAPVYLDAELGIRNLIGPNTDLGLGISGGGFGDSYFEIRRGKYIKEESFLGHGGEVAMSLYHRFNPADRIPLNGIMRVAAHESFFEGDTLTSSGFELPDDQLTVRTRAGLRFGGREPLMINDVAFELSAWYESRLRQNAHRYGFANDRNIESVSHLFWARALLSYTLEDLGHQFTVSLTGGTSLAPDRFTSYRLGAVLPLASEFPLTLPGYFSGELSARQFGLFSAQYSIPLDAERRWHLIGMAATSVVDYAPGLNQPGNWHSGLSGGIAYRSPGGMWQILAGYAYGVDAIRSDGRGANSVGILCQVDLDKVHAGAAASPSPDVPLRSHWFFRLFR